jgi:hypothetical protein
MRVPPLQQRFGTSVAGLLAKIRQHCTAPMVPYDGRRRKTDCPASLKQSPADVDVIPGLPECWIKASHV